MVGVAQLVEHQVVALVAEGSSPFAHPILKQNPVKAGPVKAGLDEGHHVHGLHDPALSHPDIGGRIFNRPFVRVRQDGRHQGGLFPGKGFSALGEIFLGRRFRPGHPCSPVNGIEIHFKNPVLVPEDFNQNRIINFSQFPENVAAG